MGANQDNIFFYRNPELQEQMKQLWAEALFVENRKTPETFTTFWQNIHALKGKDIDIYAREQCFILKKIQLQNMVVVLEEDGLFIQDKTDEDGFAILDFRVANNNELRGAHLMELLLEYRQNHKGGTVYDALNEMLHTHYNPDFLGAVNYFKWSSRQAGVVFQAIDVVLALPGKLMPASEKYSDEAQKVKTAAEHRFPEFLSTLEKTNLASVYDILQSSDFRAQKYSKSRVEAIDKLLEYRSILFKETSTTGINLKDAKKAGKCHFIEQLVSVLIYHAPMDNQSFKEYVQNCVSDAESKLTEQERKDWPKGRVSTRLKDLIYKDIMHLEPLMDESSAFVVG